MNIGIITIGDEILIGQIVNRNAAWIAERCTEIGATVVLQSVVGDEFDQITTEIQRVSNEVDLIITTGGLGPTHDDITKEALARLCNSKMVVDQAWLQHLQELMKERGRELTDRNAAQALVPSNAVVLFNPLGTAPALHIQLPTHLHPLTLRHTPLHSATLSRTPPHLFALPGVPLEMQSVMNLHVVPFVCEHLKEDLNDAKEYRTLYAAGIHESSLADLLGDLGFLGTTTLAFLPNYQGVRLRVGAGGSTSEMRNTELDRVTEILYSRAGRFIVGVGSRSLPQIVGEQLHAHSHSLSVAESCTGGLLGAALTDVVGSSAWFMGGVISYSNEAKMKMLEVSSTDLENHGAVSEEVVRAMSSGVRAKFNSTWGIGITGIAGPDGGTREKPVGTVWISVSGPEGIVSKRFSFGADRRVNRERSVGTALTMLLDALKK